MGERDCLKIFLFYISCHVVVQRINSKISICLYRETAFAMFPLESNVAALPAIVFSVANNSKLLANALRAIGSIVIGWLS